jgi:hypothetical protein
MTVAAQSDEPATPPDSVFCIRRRPEASEVPDRLRVLRMGRMGLEALADRPYNVGQFVTVCLPLGANAGKRCVSARAVSCCPVEQGFRVEMVLEAACT